MTKERHAIPTSVVRRLTKYLASVQSLREEGIDWVSSQELAEMLGLTSSTVRQDLTHVDFSGTSNRGYETDAFEQTLLQILGADRKWRAVIVGAGNLGRALALHEEFVRRGFRICGIFDNDGRKVGRRIGDLAVRSVSEVGAIVGSRRVDIGIIAVTAGSAQIVADQLVLAGVLGLLNLTPAHISVSDDVAVIDSRIMTGLLELSYAIRRRV